MHAVLVSTGVVALAEIGDKTQLLALLLAARFRKPLPILVGVFLATIANHAGAALIGVWLTKWFAGPEFQIVLGASFVLMGLWTLKPDTLNEEKDVVGSRWGAFLTTLVSFFVVEIGDKTQIATVGLAAQFQSIVLVAIGTTLGMMIANAPAVILGSVGGNRLPFTVIRRVAAASFVILGIAIVLQAVGFL